MKKEYSLKIYDKVGTFVANIGAKEFSFSSFKASINGGLGELSFEYFKKFDNFDEERVIGLNKIVELWVVDTETGSTGKRIYSGFISSYEPYIDGLKEGVNVTCLGFLSKLAVSLMREDKKVYVRTNTEWRLSTDTDRASSCEVAEVMKEIIDRYNEVSGTSIIDYTDDSILASGQGLTYTWEAAYWKDAIDTCLKASPSKWFYYLDADNVFHFKPKASTAKHHFIFGRHFKKVSAKKTMENIINNVLFTSTNNELQIMRRYGDKKSAELYDERWEKVTDSRVNDVNTANNIGFPEVQTKRTPDVATVIEVIDGTYDVESIEPGDTCSLSGFNDITSLTFSDLPALYALALDGVDSYFSFPRLVADDITLFFRIRTTITGGSGKEDYEVSKWQEGTGVICPDVQNANGNYFGISLYNGKLFAGIGQSAVYTWEAINDGEWHNIFFERDKDGQTCFYVDDQRFGGANFNNQNSLDAFANFLVGTQDGVTFADIDIDDLFIYNRILNPIEKRNLIDGLVPTTGLVNGFGFDEGMGEVIYDYAKNSAPMLMGGCAFIDRDDLVKQRGRKPLVLQILSKTYNQNGIITLELENIKPNIGLQVVQNEKMLESQEGINRPEEMDTTTDGWMDIPEFQNGWGVFGDANYDDVKFMRDTEGMVHFKGLAGHTNPLANGVVMFNLPDGFRPKLKLVLSLQTGDNQFSRVDIQPNGDVVKVSGATNANWVSFTNVQFKAAQ